jgi:hypothetical protein
MAGFGWPPRKGITDARGTCSEPSGFGRPRPNREGVRGLASAAIPQGLQRLFIVAATLRRDDRPRAITWLWRNVLAEGSQSFAILRWAPSHYRFWHTQGRREDCMDAGLITEHQMGVSKFVRARRKNAASRPGTSEVSAGNRSWVEGGSCEGPRGSPRDLSLIQLNTFVDHSPACLRRIGPSALLA